MIYSCINAGFIDRFGLNLKGLSRLKKYLKQKTNKYVDSTVKEMTGFFETRVE